ncbi:DUF3375 domain-containing protein [Mucilaginibacter sp. UR6-1]|uniref:DUF3375 domain-containing protein n=1 Tax=Mucilaginibacter sp. UR6-1 TaxID=1435643 RepID=UPI001E4F81C6|nr:DUF3375 domain-containing protein [Mucilaginibacter sp. UR6-1]MCC8409322.1 DUF3375 domain-containing protein [Mucilaginibacter sp. UR6-1]
MSEQLSSLLKITSLVNSHVSLKLLRAKSLPLLIAFLYQEYKANDMVTIPYQQLIQKLGDFLEKVEYSDDDDDLISSRLILDFDEKAKLYINRWIDANYLRNVMDDSSKVPLVVISKYTEKVFQVFDLLKEREFVGTESKFKDIFYKLRDIVENANPDKEKRLLELERRKQVIDEEIRQIKIDGYVSTYEDYQIKSRYEEINRLANELIGDFKEVEDNFKEITRRIYESQQEGDLTKGRILEETFDAIYELRQTSQGKSFYAFWQFMMDDVSQSDFRLLTKEVYRVMEDRGIATNTRYLRKLKSLLHLAARKVLDKNGVLADKLSREIIAKDQLESRKTRELMASIRNLAIKRLYATNEKGMYLEIDERKPYLQMPLERKLGEYMEKSSFSGKAEKGQLTLSDLEDLSKIYSADLIDKQILINNINKLLQDKGTVTLKEVVGVFAIEKGLAELLAYVSLINFSPMFYVNDQIKENILFDKKSDKYLELPQIIFCK